ncbi:hypothetical protein AMK09_01975 [Streptomyces sp. CB02488]|uniref:RNA polymerase sigma factor n=1 Tax=Streptomyces sp. CB02488 TaxID=1703920 RepID=UPI00095CC793|nr:hypothetical protein AMK09_01975 [Streptomyces sp. CB02488]
MEHSLRARIRAGDPDAFGGLFDDHAQTVFRYAVRSTGDWAGAEDIVSLTFLEDGELGKKGTVTEMQAVLDRGVVDSRDETPKK